jgi:hypothetical protein
MLVVKFTEYINFKQAGEDFEELVSRQTLDRVSGGMLATE